MVRVLFGAFWLNSRIYNLNLRHIWRVLLRIQRVQRCCLFCLRVSSLLIIVWQIWRDLRWIQRSLFCLRVSTLMILVILYQNWCLWWIQRSHWRWLQNRHLLIELRLIEFFILSFLIVCNLICTFLKHLTVIQIECSTHLELLLFLLWVCQLLFLLLLRALEFLAQRSPACWKRFWPHLIFFFLSLCLWFFLF